MPNDSARRADTLAQTVLTLAKELWTLRDRQMVLEAVLQGALAEHGIELAAAVERYQPSGVVKQRLAEERKRFLAEILESLAAPTKG